MSDIFFSSKLQGVFGGSFQKKAAEKSNDFRYSWNAHLFTIFQRKCIIVTNKRSMYSFMRLDILKKDFSDFRTFFLDSLQRQLHADGLLNDDEKNYWAINQDVFTYKTDNDKRVIGIMNQFVTNVKLRCEINRYFPADIMSFEESSIVNTMNFGPYPYHEPIEEYRRLQQESRSL